MSETTSFVVSFTRDDLPYLAAAVRLDRKAIAWFDLDGSSLRLSVLGAQLSMVRPLRATITGDTSELPVSGFGIPAAELPSVMLTAKKQKWTSIALDITPHHHTGTIVQDRTVLTGGIALEDGLFEGILEEDEEDLAQSHVTLSWERPKELDGLTLPDNPSAIQVTALRECLATADKLVVANAGNPQYEVLEVTDGLAHAATLNLRFCIETPALKGLDLRLHRAQLLPLALLFDRFDVMAGARFATTVQHHVFTDGLTTLYAAIPSASPPQQGNHVLAGRPNTEAVIESATMNAGLKHPLRTGRGAAARERVLQLELKDAPKPGLVMRAYKWTSAVGLGRAGKIHPVTSETTFDLLTEQGPVERVLTACTKRITLQANSEWLYIRSKGALTHLTAKIRAYSRDHRRIELQIASLPKLA